MELKKSAFKSNNSDALLRQSSLFAQAIVMNQRTLTLGLLVGCSRLPSKPLLPHTSTLGTFFMMIPIHTLTKSSLVTFSFRISIKRGAILRDQQG